MKYLKIEVHDLGDYGTTKVIWDAIIPNDLFPMFETCGMKLTELDGWHPNEAIEIVDDAIDAMIGEEEGIRESVEPKKGDYDAALSLMVKFQYALKSCKEQADGIVLVMESDGIPT